VTEDLVGELREGVKRREGGRGRSRREGADVIVDDFKLTLHASRTRLFTLSNFLQTKSLKLSSFSSLAVRPRLSSSPKSPRSRQVNVELVS
jgi:hypothetical protein